MSSAGRETFQRPFFAHLSNGSPEPFFAALPLSAAAAGGAAEEDEESSGELGLDGLEASLSEDDADPGPDGLEGLEGELGLDGDEGLDGEDTEELLSSEGTTFFAVAMWSKTFPLGVTLLVLETVRMRHQTSR